MLARSVGQHSRPARITAAAQVRRRHGHAACMPSLRCKASNFKLEAACAPTASASLRPPLCELAGQHNSKKNKKKHDETRPAGFRKRPALSSGRDLPRMHRDSHTVPLRTGSRSPLGVTGRLSSTPAAGSARPGRPSRSPQCIHGGRLRTTPACLGSRHLAAIRLACSPRAPHHAS